MSDKLFFTQAQISAVADAIREKTGESGLLKIGDMPEKIKGIGAGVDPNELLSQILAGTYSGLDTLTYTGTDYSWHIWQGQEGTGSWLDTGFIYLLSFFKVKKLNVPNLERVQIKGFDGQGQGTTPTLEEIDAGNALHVEASNLSGLKKVNFPEAEYLEDSGFFGCPKIKKIELPSIRYFNCTTATPFSDLTESDENGDTLGALSRLDFGAGLESLKYDYDSTWTTQPMQLTGANLRELILRTTSKVLEPVGYLPTAFTAEGGEGYVYVPGDLLESYKEQWANLTTHFKTLEEIPEWTED